MSSENNKKIEDTGMTLKHYSNLLDKLCEFDKPKKQNKIYQTLIFEITIAIISIMITALICLTMYNKNISVESIISVLLAFFSIFISMFFYIKASETSNSFFDRSYDIMKDVSVSLGKIEERFGERLNSMNNTLSSLSLAKVETKEDLQQVDDKKDEMIKELMNQLEQKGIEQETYKKRLNNINAEAQTLRNKMNVLENDENRNIGIRHRTSDDKTLKIWVGLLGEKDKHRLINGGRISPENIDAYNIGIQMGLIDEEGMLTNRGKYICNRLFNFKNEVVMD